MIRNSIEDLAHERRDVNHFVMDELIRIPDEKVLMDEIFEAYIEWRKRMKLPPTILMIKSFGVLFPKNFPRETFYKNGMVGRGIYGVKLKVRQ